MGARIAELTSFATSAITAAAASTTTTRESDALCVRVHPFLHPHVLTTSEGATPARGVAAQAKYCITNLCLCAHTLHFSVSISLV